MNRKFSELPTLRESSGKDKYVGIIGCGKFAYSTIAYFLTKNFGHVIRGCMDHDVHRAASLAKRFGLDYYTDDPGRLMTDPRVELIFIASRHSSHAEYAIDALRAGKTVHIEKPHVVSEDQLIRLCAAMETSPGRVALGFNRPISPIGRQIKDALRREEGTAMLNWFLAGHQIDLDHWYYRPEEGGRILGNLCHWTDFSYQMIDEERRFPITVIPTRSSTADHDVAVSYVFGDGSIAAITFSAKGHTFEGAMERFAAHRGDTLISMDDFKKLVIQVREKKYVRKNLHRDHGHEDTIRKSRGLVRPGRETYEGCSASYVWETGQVFLKTREALEQQISTRVEAFDPAFITATKF